MDQSHLRWAKDDGVGRTVRNGLNFTERGFGVRAALGCSDRGHTAVSQLEAGRHRLGQRSSARKARAGSTPAASSPRSPRRRPRWPARRWKRRASHGTIISYDLNYRASLWKSIGGQKRAQEVNRELAPLRRRDDRQRGGLHRRASASRSKAWTRTSPSLDPENFRKMIETRGAGVPELQGGRPPPCATRSTATVNDWGAVCYHDGKFYQAADAAKAWRSSTASAAATPSPPASSTASSTGKGPQWAVECGAAHGALAMTTPGDTTMATLAEVERVMKGGGARVSR